MGTFGSWLADQVGRQDDIGIVAGVWSAATDRPRLSGVKSISEWVAQRVPEHVLPPDRVNQALLRASYEYREVNAGRTPVVAAVPDLTVPGAGEPAAPDPQPGALDQAGSPAVMAALGRIERMIAGLVQELEPLVDLAREVRAGQEAEAQAAGDAEAWAGQPPPADAAAWRAEGEPGIAAQALGQGGWVPAQDPAEGGYPDVSGAGVPQAPAPAPLAGLYGDTPSQAPAEPNWAALAEAADPGQAG